MSAVDVVLHQSLIVSGDGKIWSLFIGEEATPFIRSIKYHLHPTFSPNVVLVHEAPFLIKRTGWGAFKILGEIIFNHGYKCKFSYMLDFNIGSGRTKKTNITSYCPPSNPSRKNDFITMRQSLRQEVGGFQWSLLVDNASINRVDSITYHLHPTFTPSEVTATDSPFLIRRIGWGAFEVGIDVCLRDGFTGSHRHMLDFSIPSHSEIEFRIPVSPPRQERYRKHAPDCLSDEDQLRCSPALSSPGVRRLDIYASGDIPLSTDRNDVDVDVSADRNDVDVDDSTNYVLRSVRTLTGLVMDVRVPEDATVAEILAKVQEKHPDLMSRSRVEPEHRTLLAYANYITQSGAIWLLPTDTLPSRAIGPNCVLVVRDSREAMRRCLCC